MLPNREICSKAMLGRTSLCSPPVQLGRVHNQGDTPRGGERSVSSPLRSYAKGKNSLWLLNSDTYRLVCWFVEGIIVHYISSYLAATSMQHSTDSVAPLVSSPCEVGVSRHDGRAPSTWCDMPNASVRDSKQHIYCSWVPPSCILLYSNDQQ